MLSLLTTLIPLDIASTLSPGIFALALILLGSRWHPKARAAALLLGTIIVGIFAGLLGFVLGKTVPDIKPTLISSIVDLIIGGIFIFLAAKALLVKERKFKTSKIDTGKQLFKWLTIGVIVSATNFDALFLTFTAGKEVGESATSEFLKYILLFVNLNFFVLPTSLPLVIYLLFPGFAGPFLININRYVLKYCKYIIFALFLILGIFFIKQGWEFFL